MKIDFTEIELGFIRSCIENFSECSLPAVQRSIVRKIDEHMLLIPAGSVTLNAKRKRPRVFRAKKWSKKNGLSDA